MPSPTAPTRLPGYYWVKVATASRRHLTLMGRYFGAEAWVGMTPWRVDGEWFGESQVRVLGPRLEPPEEEPAG